MNHKILFIILFATLHVKAEEIVKEKITTKGAQAFEQFQSARATAKKELFDLLERTYDVHGKKLAIGSNELNEYVEVMRYVQVLSDSPSVECLFDVTDIPALIKYAGYFHPTIVNQNSRCGVEKILYKLGEESALACFEALKSKELDKHNIINICQIIKTVKCTNYNKRLDELGANHPALVEGYLKYLDNE